VLLTNLAGHKFPSGYPSRLLSVEFYVNDENGTSMFRSGGIDSNHEVIGRDEPWEPHYDVIRNEDEVQIYEMVFADIAGNATTVLERAHTLIKDNRLAPRGFSMQHSTYDTVRIGGLAETDPNFNRLNGVEGSGTDRIEYRVATNGYVGPISAGVRVWYQSVPPRWMEEMFAWDDPEINSFKDMYDAADHTPVLVHELEIGSTTSVGEHRLAAAPQLFPNPTFNGRVRISGLDLTSNRYSFAIFGLNGRMHRDYTPLRSAEITLPGAGTWLIVVRDEDGQSFVLKAMAL
jgi:hypothetical protein